MQEEIIDGILHDVKVELHRAIEGHAPYNSAHEGYAIIKEELDELWDEVKKKNPSILNMRQEALQVATTGIRFILDIVIEDLRIFKEKNNNKKKEQK